MLMSFLLLVQGYKEAMLRPISPCGIYQADLSTCAAEDKGFYGKIFEDYLSITKDSYSTSSLGGRWSQKGNIVSLRSQWVGLTELDKGIETNFKSIAEGMTFEIISSGDLIFNPGKDDLTKSKVTFRQLKPVTIFNAISQASQYDVRSSDSMNVLRIHLMMQLVSTQQENAKTYVAILKSGEDLSIRTKAAEALVRVKDQKIVQEVGEFLLQQKPSSERSFAAFLRRMTSVLQNAENPVTFRYAEQGFERGLLSSTAASSLAASSHHKDAAAFIVSLSKAANENSIRYFLRDLRKVSPKDALALAKKNKNSEDELLQIEVLRTIAECEQTEALRNKGVQELVDLFPGENSLTQSEIIETYGDAQTQLALNALKTLQAGRYGKSFKRDIEKALAKYAKK